MDSIIYQLKDVMYKQGLCDNTIVKGILSLICLVPRWASAVLAASEGLLTSQQPAASGSVSSVDI